MNNKIKKTMKKIITKVLGAYLNTLAQVAPGKAARDGFYLFCRPFRAKLTNYHKKFLQTADQFSFDHDGINIQAYRFGNGPKKVLFLHGWQSHTFRWKAYIDALDKEEYTIYAFDAPGHGLSGGSYLNVPFYGEIITQLIETIGDVHAVVGHSLGGFSTLYMLHQKPNVRVGRAILMAPPGEANDFIQFYQNMLGLNQGTMKLINDYFTNEFSKPITWFSTTKFAGSVAIPGLIIHDKEDREAPYHYAERINNAWPQSRLITTEGFGHNLKSPEVVKMVTGFLEEELLVRDVKRPLANMV
jgi:pimeloyl-ACP methyl ester carboxylesterase